jgi:hypothetical protein
MRYEDEDDPKKPQPTRRRLKGEGDREAQEHAPYAVRKDDDRDHHRHVC